MDTNKMKSLAYDELHALYRNFPHSQNISKATSNTNLPVCLAAWEGLLP
ncbi:hypothetical protein [Clostridium estertheticum]|nr:hypothetical protein [Clostridium estertheticum]MBU3169909.1 hypothetical protein [Clostridium estertheticum]